MIVDYKEEMTVYGLYMVYGRTFNYESYALMNDDCDEDHPRADHYDHENRELDRNGFTLECGDIEWAPDDSKMLLNGQKITVNGKNLSMWALPHDRFDGVYCLGFVINHISGEGPRTGSRLHVPAARLAPGCCPTPGRYGAIQDTDPGDGAGADRDRRRANALDFLPATGTHSRRR